MNKIDYLQSKIKQGLWSFSFEQMEKEIGYSPKNKIAVYQKNGRIIIPARGFHVIVPEEYVNTNRLPVNRYIDSLMAFYDRPYYVALLTAASYWGSAHQSPMVFQVITNYNRRNIRIQNNQINFYRRQDMETAPVVKQKSYTGYFNLSTPEVTFLDLVLFNRQIGGLSRAGEIVYELAEQFSERGLWDALPHYSNPIIQRSGYLLELLELEKYARVIEKYLDTQNMIYSYLDPSGNRIRENQEPRWKIFINDQLDIEI